MSNLILFITVAYLPPATKLGQGYVFTRVCDSVHRGVSRPTPMGEVEGSDQGGLQTHTQGGGWGVWLGEGGLPHCMLGYTPTPPPGWLLLWAVRILLECILVLNWIQKESVTSSMKTFLIWRELLLTVTDKHRVELLKNLLYTESVRSNDMMT